jgi:hypothetical protein
MKDNNQYPEKWVKTESKYRVGRRSGTVILTVNGQTEIGRIHDPEMALRVCDFLNKPANNDYAVKVINARIEELCNDLIEADYVSVAKINELRHILKLLLTPNN